MHVDPLVSPILIALFALLYVGLTVLFYWPLRRILSRGYWQLLLALKALALALALAVLLNPYRLERRPDPAAFQVVYLVDASGSMQTRDIPGERQRIDVVKEKALDASPFFASLRSQFNNLATYIFSSDELRRSDGTTTFGILPGDTDIDGVLKKVLTAHGDRLKLGAVVLVTDGLDNRGVSLLEAAAPYKNAGVPIHVIGVGDSAESRDISIEWTTLPRKAIKAKPMTLAAQVNRNFTGDHTARVEIHESGRLIESRTVNFRGDATAMPIQIEHTSFTTGFKTFKLRVEPMPGEENQVNNIDYAGLQVSDPDIFRVLYFSTMLDWEYKYLNLLASREERFRLDAVVQLGKEQWFVRGLSDDVEIRGLPEADLLHDYDALLISLQSLQSLTSEELARLVSFVENRGGGLLLTGVTDVLPESMNKVLPLRSLPEDVSVAQRTELDFKAGRLLAKPGETDFGKVLRQLYLPAGSPYYRIPPEELKPGAIDLASTREDPWVVLAAQQYGAGKIVLLNLGLTWQWAMTSPNGPMWYGNFWAHLISWSASSLQERLRLRPAGAKLALGEEQILTLDLLDASYRPDNQATITASFFAPSGREESVNFIQDARIDGRYVAKFVPREMGEYRWVIDAKLSDGSTLATRTDHVVMDSSPESQPAPMAEERLNSLARITGGTYWNYRDLDRIGQIPIAPQQRFLDSRHYWLNSWWFLVVAVLAFLPDWIFRRRIGLR